MSDDDFICIWKNSKSRLEARSRSNLKYDDYYDRVRRLLNEGRINPLPLYYKMPPKKCIHCGVEFPKPEGMAWTGYALRKYCGYGCARKANSQTKEKPEGYEYTYEYVHVWLTRKYGKPTTCENCGAQPGFRSGRNMVEWANIMGGVLRKRRDYYKPMCVKCHRLYDRRKSHCKRGHEFTVENSIYSKDGWRKCRACVNANWVRASQKRKQHNAEISSQQ